MRSQLENLGHNNFMWRIQAQQQLIYGGYSDELGDYLERILTESRYVDDMGNDPMATHAVWVLEGLGQLESNAQRWGPLMEGLLSHPAWVTRRNAIMAMPRIAATSQSIVDACMVNDDHGHVRLQAMVALEESPDVSGETDMWTTFDNVDNEITSARNDAGISTSGSRPCEPDYDAAVDTQVVAVGEARQNAIGYRLNLKVHRGAIELPRSVNLPSGELNVYDIAGKNVYQTSYDASKSEWTVPEISGLKPAMYTYLYKDVNGGVTKNRLPVLIGL